jgi:DNA-directed RNA polymerase subunit L
MAVILTRHFYNQLEREIEMLDMFQKTERKKRRAPIDHEDYIVIKAHIVNNMARLFIDNQDGTFTYRKGNDDHTVANELRDLVPNIVQQNVSFVRQKQKPPIKLKLPNGQTKRAPDLARRVAMLEQRVDELAQNLLREGILLDD